MFLQPVKEDDNTLTLKAHNESSILLITFDSTFHDVCVFLLREDFYLHIPNNNNNFNSALK